MANRERRSDWGVTASSMAKKMMSGRFKEEQQEKRKRASIVRLFYHIRRIDKQFGNEKDFFYDKIAFHRKLEGTDIRIPDIYAKIDREKNWNIFWNEIKDIDTFVIKPNRLSEGRSIRVLTKTEDPEVYKEITGNLISVDTIKRETMGCLRRKTNNARIRGRRNVMFAEERVFTHDKFRNLTVDGGIVDFRVYLLREDGEKKVIYAKMRCPTEKSGLGNTARGAIAMHVGIKGKVRKSDVMTNTVLSYKGKNYKSWKVPFWSNIVETCEKVGDLFKSPFHSVDCTVNRKGEVVVIEAEKIPLLRFFTKPESMRIANTIIEYAENELFRRK